MKKKIKVIQQRNGKTVSFLVPDKGKPGTTPENEHWYHPQVQDTGWQKDLPEAERREAMLQAHKGDVRAAGRAMIALANVTNDLETSRKARDDAKYFFRQLKKDRIFQPRRLRITKRTPKLR